MRLRDQLRAEFSLQPTAEWACPCARCEVVWTSGERLGPGIYHDQFEQLLQRMNGVEELIEWLEYNGDSNARALVNRAIAELKKCAK